MAASYAGGGIKNLAGASLYGGPFHASPFRCINEFPYFSLSPFQDIPPAPVSLPPPKAHSPSFLFYPKALSPSLPFRYFKRSLHSPSSSVPRQAPLLQIIIYTISDFPKKTLDKLYYVMYSIMHKAVWKEAAMDAQLKKGLLDVCVLSVLRQRESYGYKIIADIAPYIEISESTLYPILKRLK